MSPRVSRLAGDVAALDAGIWSGAVVAGGGARADLVHALPAALLLIPAGWIVQRGWQLAVKVVASWLIARRAAGRAACRPRRRRATSRTIWIEVCGGAVPDASGRRRLSKAIIWFWRRPFFLRAIAGKAAACDAYQDIGVPRHFRSFRDRITLEQANAVIAGAFAKGADLGLKPLTVVVLDAGGHIIALQRQDGASTLRPQIAAGKAGGALAIGVSSRKIADMTAERPSFFAALGPIAPHGVIPAAGGVIVVDADGLPIGAVGITGDTSDNDEACALAGLAAAGLEAQR